MISRATQVLLPWQYTVNIIGSAIFNLNFCELHIIYSLLLYVNMVYLILVVFLVFSYPWLRKIL